LIKITFPSLVNTVLGIFRASGRFGFPIHYFLIALIFIIIINFTRKTIIIFGLFFLAALLNISELQTKFMDLRWYATVKKIYTNTLQSKAWDDLCKDHTKLIFLQNNVMTLTSVYDLANMAAKNNLTMNNCYTARHDRRTSGKIQKITEEISKGVIEEKTIYVFGSTLPLYAIKTGLNFYDIKGVIIGIKDNINELSLQDGKKITLSERGLEISLDNENYMTNGKKTAEGRTLAPKGISFGPYTYLDHGEYLVSVRGTNLQYASFDIYSDNAKEIFPPTFRERSTTEVIFEFSLPTPINDFEIRVFNISETETIDLNNIFLKPLSDKAPPTQAQMD
jgi:hypothetical protein